MATEETDTKEVLDKLIEILDNPESRILPLLYGSKNDNDDDGSGGGSKNKEYLVNIVKHLFLQNEILAKQYLELTKKKNGNGDDGTPVIGLSGLPELYVSPGGGDAETMWGQVDLQNKALNKLVKKSTKRLSKEQEKICILDMGEILSDQDSDDNSDNGSDAASDDDESKEEGGESGSDDEDEEARRIRERMERAMDDMDEDEEMDDEEEEEEEETNINKSFRKANDEESLEDPVAEELKDGFFDLNEMEDFADEEEDYLPDEAFGKPQQESKTKKKKKSFHQRQRDGDFDDSDNDDDDSEDMYENFEPVQRKKYRDVKEIDALYTLYQPVQNDGDSDFDEEEEENDPANMTAADLFGKPKMSYYEKYYKGKGKKDQGMNKKDERDNDDDSWGEYDFEKEDKSGWRNENENNKDASEGSSSDNDDDNDDDHEEAGGELDESDKNNIVDDSKHSRQTEKLRRQTEQLEKEMIAEKPWQMTGESTSTSRPVNSLLEGTPEFEMASKQAPTITVEQTADLEEVIKKRILAEDWDDVVPRELPDVGWHKKRGELPEVSQEKSKLGLGELYEREYLKKAVGYDVDAAEKQSEEDKAKDEMKQLFANLCSKLDGLSNYHFAPRPIADEAEVRPVTAAAIAMEEVLPLHVSDARGVAPEEVYATKRGREGVLKGESEMEQDDRKRLRSSKKAARRKARKEKLADEKLISRLEPGLGLNNPYEKRKMREELAMARSRGKVTTGEKDMDNIKFGSSGTFFKKLQSEAQQSIHDKAAGNNDDKSSRSSKPKSSAFKL